ncbi:hypothetical protein [Pseudochelatococcus sp. G4_1912]|uniref:hypothetical protein n=1 Tax=Pseudochelatococcus sp. G4_1912 TaxID=3114288 RepID=UPI0039C74ACC
MTTLDADNADFPEGEKAPEKTSIREVMGLEVEHLLPGLSIAAKMLQRGDEEGALRTYATLVLCDPNEPRFQQGLAACALKIGQHAVALQAASAIIAFWPESPEGYHFSAHACIGLEEYEAAIEDFTDALRLAQQTGNEAIASDSERMIGRIGLILERKKSDDGESAASENQEPLSAS